MLAISMFSDKFLLLAITYFFTFSLSFTWKLLSLSVRGDIYLLNTLDEDRFTLFLENPLTVEFMRFKDGSLLRSD